MEKKDILKTVDHTLLTQEELQLVFSGLKGLDSVSERSHSLRLADRKILVQLQVRQVSWNKGVCAGFQVPEPVQLEQPEILPYLAIPPNIPCGPLEHQPTGILRPSAKLESRW